MSCALRRQAGGSQGLLGSTNAKRWQVLAFPQYRPSVSHARDVVVANHVVEEAHIVAALVGEQDGERALTVAPGADEALT